MSTSAVGKPLQRQPSLSKGDGGHKGPVALLTKALRANARTQWEEVRFAVELGCQPALSLVYSFNSFQLSSFSTEHPAAAASYLSRALSPLANTITWTQSPGFG